MTTLKSRKREAFAQAVAANECSAAEAYRRHVSRGNCTVRTAEVAASQLLRAGSEVALRVSELRKLSAVVAEREFSLTRTAWLGRLLRLADEAEAAGDYSAARGCLREIGQAMPQWYEAAAEKSEIRVVIGTV